MIDRFELTDYLSHNGFSFKEKGRELVLGHCPYCESGRAKSPFQHFYFSSDNGTFFCHKCQVRGNLNKFKYDRGDLPLVTKAKIVNYKCPEPTNRYDADEGFYSSYEKSRGISTEILKKYQVGKTIRDGKQVYVYRYFDRSGKLLNRKFRSADKKTLWTEKDAEQGYYGLQFVNFDVKELHVCEGEDDCHALAQMGLTNIVSVPFGAGNYSPSMDSINQCFDKLILIYDNDEKGQVGARKFAEKAGLGKCKNVILPFKDARECLQNGVEFFDIAGLISKSEPFRHENIIKAGDASDLVANNIYRSKRVFGYMTRIREWNKITGGMRLGELSVLIGQTGRGKSTFGYNLASWAVDGGMNAMILPFENRIESVVKKMVEIETGKSLQSFDEGKNRVVPEQPEEWLTTQIDVLNKKPLYFLNRKRGGRHGYFDIKKIQEIIEYAARFYDVNFFVIDHLHYFLKLSNARNPVHVLDESMRTIKMWTDEYNCHIVLIVHPHMTQDSKAGKLSKLGLNSTKGSSAISQEADNFWIVERSNEEDNRTRIRVEKNREFGKTGPVDFSVMKNCNTFYVEDGKPQCEENGFVESFSDQDAEQQSFWWQN